MIYWELFLGFAQVGCFAFGGAYSAIPLIRDVVLSRGWLTEEALTRMIAVSESTPGPIMVNLATYVGNSQAGLAGAVTATLAVVLPSFFVILLVMSLARHVLKNKYVQAVLRGMKPCIIGIILATGVTMTVRQCLTPAAEPASLLIAGVLLGVCVLWRWGKKKALSPIALIALSALLGMMLYG